MEHLGKKAIFRVEEPMLYASHASAVTGWEHQKAVAAANKAAKAKKKPNPKQEGYPPAEPAHKPTKPDLKPKAKRPPQPQRTAAPEAAPMEVHAVAQPWAPAPAQTRAQTHA